MTADATSHDYLHSDSLLRVAAAQTGPSSGEAATDGERVHELIDEAGRQSVSWVCFPELTLGPYFGRDATAPDDWFHSITGPIIRNIVAAAKKSRVGVILPFAESAVDGRFNSAAIVDSHGEIRGCYRKVHLPGAERNHFLDGETIAVHEVGGLRMGILICADRSYPEAWRIFGIGGAQIVFAPYGTALDGRRAPSGSSSGPEVMAKRVRLGCPSGADPMTWLREFHEIQMRACASMNGFFVVAAGKAGTERGTTYIGASMIISPWGNVLARATGTRDELVISTIDLSLVEGFQATGRYDRRRPAAYGAITETTP